MCKKSVLNIIVPAVLWKNIVKLVVILNLLVSLPAFSVGVSAIRIYLDNTRSEQSFAVYNKVPENQVCDLLLRHFEIAENGELKAYPDDQIPKNSAKNWIRFSPRKFTLKASESQSVRFRLRRKPNSEVAEFRSYLTVDCKLAGTKSALNADIQFSLVPRLRHNIPIIVRTGKLEASVEFTDINVTNKQIKFSVVRQGTRSVYGHLALINSRTNEIISQNPSFVIYPETQKKSVAFMTKGINSANLSIRFVENKNEGGSINYLKTLQ